MRSVFTLRRAVISLLLAGAAAALIAAAALREDPEPVRFANAAVRVVSPTIGQQSVPRQSTVFVELQSGYELDALQVQGQAVGGDDLDHIAGLNRWSFSPGDGKSIERLPGGRTCAVAEFRRVGASGEPERFSWCFFVN